MLLMTLARVRIYAYTHISDWSTSLWRRLLPGRSLLYGSLSRPESWESKVTYILGHKSDVSRPVNRKVRLSPPLLLWDVVKGSYKTFHYYLKIFFWFIFIVNQPISRRSSFRSLVKFFFYLLRVCVPVSTPSFLLYTYGYWYRNCSVKYLSILGSELRERVRKFIKTPVSSRPTPLRCRTGTFVKSPPVSESVYTDIVSHYTGYSPRSLLLYPRPFLPLSGVWSRFHQVLL